MSEIELIKIDETTIKIFKSLKDDSRLAIFLYLMTNKKLTLKQLSNALNKGKTTIHHHIRRLEDEELVVWEEKEEDKKKLKTRYYFLNYPFLQKAFGKKTKI